MFFRLSLNEYFEYDNDFLKEIDIKFNRLIFSSISKKDFEIYKD